MTVLTIKPKKQMRHLNYTHLFYFWNVAEEGGVTRAAEALHLTPQTISGQIKLLEQAVGEALFVRVGRGLQLTDTGKVVKEYADEIFAIGAELTQRVNSQQTLVVSTLNVGVVDSIPKLISLRILEPALKLAEPVKMTCREGSLDNLLGELAVHHLDLVISNRPIPTGTSVKAYSHALGESGISLFAHKSISRSYRSGFPKSLHQAPLLALTTDNPVRRAMDSSFAELDVQPEIIAEFGDSALLKAFGEAGLGVFPAPTVMQSEVVSMYHSTWLGELDGVKESYYAISPERKLKHPAILEITERARALLFP